jgi:hypothetical protein
MRVAILKLIYVFLLLGLAGPINAIETSVERSDISFKKKTEALGRCVLELLEKLNGS